MNTRNTTRRRRTISIVSSLPPPATVVSNPPRAIVVPRHRRATIPPQTIVRVDRPANAPPVGVPTKSVVVGRYPIPTIYGRIIQPPLVLRRISAVPNPTPLPHDPTGGVTPPYIRIVRRPPWIPPVTIPTVARTRTNIPQPTKSLVVRRFPDRVANVAPRVVKSGQVYLRSESAIHAANVVPRFPAPKPIPARIARSIWISPHDPDLVVRNPQRVVPRFVPQTTRWPTIMRTALPAVRRCTTIVANRFVQTRAVSPRIVLPSTPPNRWLASAYPPPRVVQVVRRPKVAYPTIQVRTVNNNQIPNVDPLVVPRFVGRYTPFVIGRPGIDHPYQPARFMGLLENTNRDPHPAIVVASNVTIGGVSRQFSNWPRPHVGRVYMYTGAAPTPTPAPSGIFYDIIEASIDWLRQSDSIVAEFGDDKGTVDKFVSDAEPPRIEPPYAVFYEPEEVEGFETTNGTAMSSLIVGVYRIEVFSTGKKHTRILSENLADRLNDAPLLFTNGTLIYLRRTQRRYPTIEVPGTGSNIAMFKRMLEFEYQFERTYTL